VAEARAGSSMMLFDAQINGAITVGAVNANFFNNDFIENDYQVENDSRVSSGRARGSYLHLTNKADSDACRCSPTAL